MSVMSRLAVAIGLTGLIVGCAGKPSALTELEKTIPATPREFRAAWVATVANIDWPSGPGLSSEEQQREAIAILDKAVELKLNAIILQVRTSADALYPSKLEPWSEYLTGTQGQPPEPLYDPLKFWIDEAHVRGIQLHAWFNPFRARLPAAKSKNAPAHVSNSHPEWVKQYGGFQWMDPGSAAARRHTLSVFMDVVKRYDVDGIHIDDYFYPYPIKETPPTEEQWQKYQAAGGRAERAVWEKENMQLTPFPDTGAWASYVKNGGKLKRDDWRRDNINRMVSEIYTQTKRQKKRVQFGISPFGIWQPGHPPGIAGLNQYESLYADAKLWLNRGWCDYYTPQLYWAITSTGQAYGKLLGWWMGENRMGRNLWPGNFTSRLRPGGSPAWESDEIINQIKVTRDAKDASGKPAATGNVHFSMKAFLQDWKGINAKLKEGVYSTPAVVPTSTWLDGKGPRKPKVDIEESAEGRRLVIKPGGGEKVFQWGIWMRRGKEWTFDALPARQEFVAVPEDVDAVAVFAIDRLGNESGRVIEVARASSP